MKRLTVAYKPEQNGKGKIIHCSIWLVFAKSDKVAGISLGRNYFIWQTTFTTDVRQKA